MLLILFFIIVLNIVAIVLTYYCLSDMEKKEKLIFIAMGVAIIYVLTSFVYWISTKNVAIKEVSELGKNLITFLFVPINAIIVLPILAKSYAKYKTGRLGSDKLRNRGIVLAIILVILLIIECKYFKDIQNNVANRIEENQKEQREKEENLPSITEDLLNQVYAEGENKIENSVSNTEANIIENSINNVNESTVQTNEVSNVVQNQMINE